MTIEDFLIHRYYETIPNWVETLPEDLGEFLDSLKGDIKDVSWESKVKYLAVLRHHHKYFNIPYTLTDIEFIIDNLESTILYWESSYKQEIESLVEAIDGYEESDEWDRKYDRLK